MITNPFALRKVDRKPFKAKDAIPNTTYICPSCDEQLILKSGEVIAPYFSHLPISKHKDGHIGASETIDHYNAKHKLADILNSGKHIVVETSDCVKECVTVWDVHVIKESSDKVHVEYRHPIHNWVADVTVLDQHNRIKFIVEVVHTHKTKIDRGYPWYEIKACQINELTHDLILNDIKTDAVCYKCEFATHDWIGKRILKPRWLSYKTRKSRTCEYCDRDLEDDDCYDTRCIWQNMGGYGDESKPRPLALCIGCLSIKYHNLCLLLQ